MEPNQRRLIITVAVTAILLLVLWQTSTVTIDSGEAGVLYRQFGGGTVTERTYPEGFHVLAPWNKMYLYNVRNQEEKENMTALSKNGLSIELEMSIRFRPVEEELGIIHKTLGQDYRNVIVMPEVRSSARKVIGRYDPEELYSSKRDFIQEEIFSDVKKRLEDKNIYLDAILIRGIELPPNIKTAIEKKLKQEQESKEYEFRIEKEQKEAERKRIEAQGIKDFQDIVSEGISDKLLRWKGIEATLELSKSQNTKVVVIGQGEDGLPLILGGDNR
jgi:regulator of protease activity HflC (stomatin/prohibitin superfamily)